MSFTARKFHRRIAPWLAVPLIITLATGAAYRLGRSWFGMNKDIGGRVLEVHAGGWLGEVGSSVYVVVIGLGLLLIAFSGIAMVARSRSKTNPRKLHRIIGAIFLLPLAVSAVTGIAFKLGEDVFHFPDETLNLLMKIHEGGWLGPIFRPFYVLFVAGGLLFLAVTGLLLAGIFHRKSLT